MVEPKHSGPASYLRSQYVSEETGVGITITEPFAQKQPHNPSQTSKAHRHKKRPWKKLLWVKQDYADNYTDSSFLSQLKRNSTVVTYSYWRLFRDFSLIGMHLSVIMSVILVFYGIYVLNWDPVKPTIISTTTTFIGFAIYVLTLKIRRNRELINLQKRKIEQLSKRRQVSPFSRPNSQTSQSSIDTLDGTLNHVNSINVSRHDLNLEKYLTEPSPPDLFGTFKSSLLILLHLLTLSPVLKSLINSSASDSIWAISGWLCFLNMLFNDYVIDFPRVSRVYSLSSVDDQDLLKRKYKSSNLSKNIALSNAIVLASRLNSNLSAFCFILFSIEVCGLFPVFNNFTRRCQFWRFHTIQIASIVFGVDYTMYRIFGLGWMACWVCLQLLIVVAGPFYFLELQKYKDELQGPWDTAHPVVKSL